jgi:hypothetical protein
VTNPTVLPRCAPIDLPQYNVEARLQALERLYRRKEALETLIESLEAYARCQAPATIMNFPSRGN